MSPAHYGDRQFRALGAETVVVAPDLAKKLRATCHFERQRPISQDHVARLASEMKLGWFLAGTPIWFCVLPDGKEIIVNGNHTLEAVAASGVSLPLTFIKQRVVDIEEAAQSYACFDIQRSRTWMQAAQAVGIDAEMPMTKWGLAATGYIVNDFKDANGTDAATTQSRRLRFDAIKEYRGALTLLHGLLAGIPSANQQIMRRAGTLAVAMAAARYQPAAAEEFWGGLVKDDGLKIGDPRRTLLRYLTNNKVAGARRDILLASALAWNAHFERRQLEAVKPGQMRIFRILGTPWASPKSSVNATATLPSPAVIASGRKRGVNAIAAQAAA